MVKRLYTILLFVAAAVVSVYADSTIYTDSSTDSSTTFYFTINDDGETATLVNETNTSGTSAPQSYTTADITIPSKLTDGTNSYTVTAIGTYCFYKCTLTSVSIPSTVTELGTGSFYLSSLQSVDLSECTKLTTLGQYSFRQCTSLESIDLSVCDSLATIGTYCFYKSTALTSVKMPSNPVNLTSLGANFCCGCTALTSIDLSGCTNMTSISGSSFSGCTALSSFKLPSGVTSLGTSCFYTCSSLTSIDLSEYTSLTSLGTTCFYYCYNATSLSLPASITTINSKCFYGCSSFTTIDLSGCTGLTTLTTDCFRECTSLTSFELPAGIETLCGFYQCLSLTEVDLSKYTSLTTLGVNSFYGCIKLTSIKLPSTVTSLGGSCFQDCTALPSIDLSGCTGLNSLGMSCFRGCTAFTEMDLSPFQITSIPNYCFYGCTNLTDVKLPSTVTSIGGNGFYQCTALTSLDLSGCTSLTSIGTKCFYQCTKLQSVKLPSSVTAFNTYTFQYCSALTDINIGNCTGLTGTLSNYCFEYCTALTSVDLSNCTALTTIGSYCFDGCTSLSEVTLPSNITALNSYSFRNCTSLTKFKCHSTSVPSLNSSAFYNLSGIPNIYVLPYLVSSYATATNWSSRTAQLYAFYDLEVGESGAATLALPFTATIPDGVTFYSLDGLGLNSSSASAVHGTSLSFSDGLLPYDTPVYITADAGTYEFLGTYSSTDSSYKLSDVSTTPTSGVLTGVYQDTDLSGNTYTLNDSGVFAEAESASSYTSYITSEDDISIYGDISFSTETLSDYSLAGLQLADTTTGTSIYFIINDDETTATITNSAYTQTSGTTNSYSGEVTVPLKVTSDSKNYFAVTAIGAYAFNGCDTLTKVDLSTCDSLATVGNYCFNNDTLLASVSLPSGVTSLGNYSFYGCKALESISVPSTVTSLGTACFRGCTSLTSIGLSSCTALTSLGNGCFRGCTALESIDMSGCTALTGLATNYTFTECTALTSFKLPENITSLGQYCFQGCTALTTVDLSGYTQLTSFSGSVFNGCSALESVTLPSTVTSLGGSCFYNCTSLASIDMSSYTALASIGNTCFFGCTSLTAIDLSACTALTSIGEYCFRNCTALASVKLPESITTLNTYCFCACTALTSVDLSACTALTKLPTYCFYQCTGLTDVTLPSSITTLSANSFNGCTSLEKIKCYSDAVPSLGNKALTDTPESLKVYVLPYLVSGYAAATNWSSYTSQLYAFYDLEVTETGAATLALPFTAAIPDGFTLYSLDAIGLNSSSAPAVTGTLLTYDDGLLPYDTPVYLTADAGTYEFLGSYSSADESYYLSEVTATSTKGVLTGVYQDTKTTGYTYTLSGKGEFAQSSTASAYSAYIVSESDLSSETITFSTAGLKLADTTTGTSIYFIVNDDETTATITNSAYTQATGTSNSYSGDVTVPKKVTFDSEKYYTVTAIGAYAFDNCGSLTKVDLSACDSLATVGNYCFNNDTLLAVVALPSGVTSLGNYSFYNCKALESISVPSTVTSLGVACFRDCTSLATIDLSSCTALTSLGNACFRGCTSLTSIDLSGCTALTELAANYTFTDCTALTSFKLPENITSLGQYCFQGCTAMTTVDLSDYSSLTSISASVFSGCSALESVTLPTGVTTISGSCFYNCTSLASIDMSSYTALASIGNLCFFGCTSLTAIDLSACTALTSIGEYCFRNCTSLASVTLPTSITTLSTYCFCGCTALTSVDLSACTALTTLPTYCFYQCTGLTDVTLPSSITTLSANSFNGCTSLEKIKCYSDAVPSLGNKALTDTPESLKVYVLPYLVSGYAAADNWSTYTSQLYAFYDLEVTETGVATLALPFTAAIPDGFTLYLLDALGTDSDDVLSVKGTALTYDDGLLPYDTPVYLTVAAGTYEILGSYSSADESYYLSAVETSPTYGVLTGVYQDTEISGYTYTLNDDGTFALATTVAAYNAYIVSEDDLSSYGETITFTTNAITSFTDAYAGKQGSYTDENGVTFYFTVNDDATTATITNSAYESSSTVTVSEATGANTYAGDIDVPEIVTDKHDNSYTVTSMGDFSFLACTSLGSVALPSTVTTIGAYAFGGTAGESGYYTTLTDIDMSECTELTSFGEGAFSYCANLTSISLPESITTLGSSCFYGCTGITYVELPANVSEIGSSCFNGCTALTKIKSYCAEVPTLGGDDAMANTSESLGIYVAPYLVSSYAAADNWSTYTSQLYPYYDLTVPEIGELTLALPFTATLPEGVTVYTLDEVGLDATETSLLVKGTDITESNDGMLPSGTPVYLTAEAGEYEILGAYAASVETVADIDSTPMSGVLSGVYKDTAASDITVDDGLAVFVFDTESGVFTELSDDATVGEYSGYIITNEDWTAFGTTITFTVDDVITGIRSHSTLSSEDGAVYTLQGVKVNPENLQRGVYIQNGRKFVVK